MKSVQKTTLLTALVAAMGLSSLAFAGDHGKTAATGGPSTNVAWTAEMMRFVAKGDISNGARLNSEAYCASCHGHAGIAPSPNWPSTAGQRAEYTFKMLKDYKDGKRAGTAHNQLMQLAVMPLSDQDMADLAKYYASFPLPTLPVGVTHDAAKAKEASKMIVRGDGSRFIAPCQSCHGSKGEGSITDTPALAGMPPEYFIKTMQEYRDGTRKNDVYARMRLIAKDLTDAEIEAMAHYYAGMTAK